MKIFADFLSKTFTYLRIETFHKMKILCETTLQQLLIFLIK